MKTPWAPRGAAPVGVMEDLTPVETAVILYFRLWHTSPRTRETASREILQAFGEIAGMRLLARFGAFCDLTTHRARRPLSWHSLSCRCVGADERGLAQMVAAATDGDHEDALFFAGLLVEHRSAPQLTELAADIGRSLNQLYAPSSTAPAAREGSVVTHTITTDLKH